MGNHRILVSCVFVLAAWSPRRAAAESIARDSGMIYCVVHTECPCGSLCLASRCVYQGSGYAPTTCANAADCRPSCYALACRAWPGSVKPSRDRTQVP